MSKVKDYGEPWVLKEDGIYDSIPDRWGYTALLHCAGSHSQGMTSEQIERVVECVNVLKGWSIDEVREILEAAGRLAPKKAEEILHASVISEDLYEHARGVLEREYGDPDEW